MLQVDKRAYPGAVFISMVGISKNILPAIIIRQGNRYIGCFLRANDKTD